MNLTCRLGPHSGFAQANFIPRSTTSRQVFAPSLALDGRLVLFSAWQTLQRTERAMDYEQIRQCLANCRFTDHARREMEAEPLGVIQVDEVLRALQTGEVIEEYPEDTPYPSCLILGRTGTGRPIHIVCAPVTAERKLAIITVYQPDPARWDPEFRRRRAT